MLLTISALVGCGPVADPAEPMTRDQLEDLPGVVTAAAGEYDGSDGETWQSIAVVDMEPDVSAEEMATVVETVAGAGVDVWAVYVGSGAIDPEYPTDDDATGFSSGDVAGMPDPVAAVESVLLAREIASLTTPNASAGVTWDEGELATEVLLPRAGTTEVTAVAEALATEDAFAGRGLSVEGTGDEPLDGRPISQLVPAATLSGDDGLDDGLLAQWDRLVEALARGDDDVRPVEVTLSRTEEGTRTLAGLHLDEPGRVYSASGDPLRPGEPGYRRYYSSSGDPSEITTAAWGDRLWRVLDPLLGVAAETPDWSVTVREVRDPLTPLVELATDSAQPGKDEYGRTWGGEAWERLRETRSRAYAAGS